SYPRRRRLCFEAGVSVSSTGPRANQCLSVLIGPYPCSSGPSPWCLSSPVSPSAGLIPEYRYLQVAAVSPGLCPPLNPSEEEADINNIAAPVYPSRAVL
ncbi:unnamed protein product, partial [Gadus morhua 'NCC']